MNIDLKKGGLFFLAAFCSATACAEIEHDFGSHGYFRIGTGLSDGDASQETFKAPGAGSKYRLGNESDNYIELDLYDTMSLSPDGAKIHVESMAVINDNAEGKFDFNEISQLYAEASNFTSALGDPKVWIGRRYYDRHDIHINDFFFLNTLQGYDGGGISDIDMGSGKLALAIGRKNADDDAATAFDESSLAQTRLDARYSDIKVNNNGALTLWGTRDTSAGDKANNIEELDGFAVGVMHTQKEFYGGFNKFMVQYGKGLGRHAGKGGLDAATGKVTTAANASNFDDANTFRIVNSNVIEPSPNWGMMTSVVYEDIDSRDFDGTDQTWLSLGARPMWFVNKNFRVPLELGFDTVKDNANGTDGSVVKATLAAELALDRGFWERPVLRAYTTHAKWSDDFKGQVGGETYANDTSGWTVGLQAETWW
ncbi:MAG: Maltoporin (maltose/maltodextrin high-affinity receptor, phage lambda receptor protein) [uncultured Thiotrichaceae bacterium]|uniref:Maltoporin (Maltose/maltodextrin high-affinity receptor, phage lambda receptor protein) n=1 Tax=uncultured Thiotrichaceae bacterium TaxID=298394 RepID=A0A6S6SP81_9GAMM|nr:MAG: Maltoporin (maltose/maltodextrin high-affinity receptor, phage lambda receptor protein) [uncultured Thiotrichaceae bacterium]